MLAKKHKEFIDLRSGPEKMSGMAMPEMEKEAPRGPSLYISDIKLPLTSKDLNEEINGKIRFKLRRITESTTNGKDQFSYDLEVVGLKIGD